MVGTGALHCIVDGAWVCGTEIWNTEYGGIFRSIRRCRWVYIVTMIPRGNTISFVIEIRCFAGTG